MAEKLLDHGENERIYAAEVADTVSWVSETGPVLTVDFLVLGVIVESRLGMSVSLLRRGRRRSRELGGFRWRLELE